MGRRERQIMEILYRLGSGSVAEVRRELRNPPTYSAVRGMLRLLEEKGYVRHQQEGLRYVYSPTGDARQARKSALRHMVHTFFGDSPQQAVEALLELSDSGLSARQRQKVLELIRQAKQEGR